MPKTTAHSFLTEPTTLKPIRVTFSSPGHRLRQRHRRQAHRQIRRQCLLQQRVERRSLSFRGHQSQKCLRFRQGYQQNPDLLIKDFSLIFKKILPKTKIDDIIPKSNRRKSRIQVVFQRCAGWCEAQNPVFEGPSSAPGRTDFYPIRTGRRSALKILSAAV